MRILTLFLFLLCVCVSGFGQQIKPIGSVATIADLIARKAVNAEELEVRNYSETVLWDQPRTFRHVIDATNAHDGVHYLTNAGASGRWVSADRTAIPQRVEWWGVVSDGTADGTAGVQAAINYCYSNNVPTLEFPAGTVLVSSVSFTGTGLVGGLSLRGQPGLRSIIRGTAATTMFTLHTMRHVTIENLWFDANNVATNILTINNSTEFKLSGNDFYQANGVGVLFTGNQNYGHLITFNTFINNKDVGLDFNGVSATANTISRNKFESPGFTNAIGIRLKGGVANQDYTANVFQSLRYGMYLEGVVGSGQINNSIDHNYFEVFTQNPIALGPLQHSVLAVTRNYFYQDFTGGTWALKDTNSTILYGFRWRDNAITSDSGKALSLTNSLVRDWEIHSAPTDIATDYELPANVPIKLWTQSQPALSVIVTNFTVSGSATNLSIPGDLLPSRVEITGSSNMTFSVGGFVYPGTTLTIRNAGTNTVTFTGINTVIRAGTEDTFLYRNSTWTRYVYPYLPDYGGTLYGSLTITNALSVAGFADFSGAVKLGNIISNFNGLITGGSIGATQAFVLRANADAILTIQRGANNYIHIGTNDGIRFERPASFLASTGILTHVYGFLGDPSTGVREGISMTLSNLQNAMGLSGVGIGGLVVGSGDTNLVTNIVASASTTPTRTNGTFALNITTVDDSAIPAGVARDSEVAASYVSLAGNNVITGANVFSGVNSFVGLLQVSNLLATNLTVGSTSILAKIASIEASIAGLTNIAALTNNNAWTGSNAFTLSLTAANLTGTNLFVGTTNVAQKLSDIEASLASNTAGTNWMFYRSYEFLSPSASRATAMGPDLAGTVIGAGGSANQLTTPITNRPGIFRLASGAGASSGYNYLTDVNAFMFGGGEECEIALRIPTTNFTAMTFGWFDVTTATLPTDGLVFRVGASGASFGILEGYAYNNGVGTVTPTTTNLVENTFYRLSISNSVTPGTVTFRLKDESNAILWSSQVTNGFPFGNTRSFGYGFSAWNTNTVSTNILDVDWAWYGIRRNANR